MLKKHCLFCDEIVSIKPNGDYDQYLGCSCSPDGFYNLQRDSYERINAFPYQKKRDLFHIVSAYIRELTDRGEKVVLSVNDLDSIAKSPNIPITIEDKGNRLLQYLYRHTEGPGEPVVIPKLNANYNLTYSPNLQELVYIIDKLINERLLIREGMTYMLTEKGWSQAAAAAGGKRAKPCLVLIGDEEDWRLEWTESLLPKIEQHGYLPSLFTHGKPHNRVKYSLEQIAESKLMIADLTGQSQGVYFAAGYAIGLNIPVIWTVNSRDAENLHVKMEGIALIVWDTAEELARILQTRLS
ncbi:hypothetical protein [Gorillibacterium massiliense]|uniref:hypothetical protein n=1 Tax=Gorillibacterium massiliense TaxID=1280390 RepID=UPI0004B164A3|nr:hypothetical protein [Gorillibacterium massiliense]